MTTNYLSVDHNRNIPQGSFRFINLCKPPFNFNIPIDHILEKTSEKTELADKSMSIWEVKSIPDYK